VRRIVTTPLFPHTTQAYIKREMFKIIAKHKKMDRDAGLPWRCPCSICHHARNNTNRE
jgi:hypothetical protein